jgi:hypothetical protein
MKSLYVFIMTRNSAILTEFDRSSHILVKNVIALHVRALLTTPSNILLIAGADAEIAAGLLFNPY